MVSVNVVQVNPFLTDELHTAGCTFMALLFEGFRGVTVVELAVRDFQKIKSPADYNDNHYEEREEE